MVSVGVSALGTTSIHFIESGVKVNGQYCREELMQKLLPDSQTFTCFNKTVRQVIRLVRQLSC